jgi:hypothetical protein
MAHLFIRADLEGATLHPIADILLAYVSLIPVLEVVFIVDCHSTIDMLIGSKKCLIILKLGFG